MQTPTRTEERLAEIPRGLARIDQAGTGSAHATIDPRPARSISLPRAPGRHQMDRMAALLAPLRRVTQPQVLGIEHIPHRPVLFVGNHSTRASSASSGHSHLADSRLGQAVDGEAARTLADWLIEHELVFDLVAHPDTLARWTRFLARRPQLSVVLEHAGWPLGIDDASYQAWERALTAFARATSAAVKISGLAMVTREITAAAMSPWIECCVDRFGWDRVLFASNFPIDGVEGSYAELLHVFDTALKGASGEHLQKLFAGNAERIYRL